MLPGASPATIRESLLPDDRTAFDDAYRSALTAARDSLDLTDLFDCLERWRRVAVLQRDPQRFASVVRRAAEALSGVPVPEGEPLAETRRRVGM